MPKSLQISATRLTILRQRGPAVANGPSDLLGVGVLGGTPYIAIRSASADTTVIRATEFS
jgi:hypothetical protein